MVGKLNVINITKNISYIEASQEPLSSDAFIINGKQNNYIYDVGANNDNITYLNNIDNKIIIISHFHADHTKILNLVNYKTLYVGKSNRIYNNSTIINKVLKIEDELELEIIPISSSHSNDSLILNINKEYLLVGDSLYGFYKDGDNYYNTQKLQETINTLNNINTKYIVLSHEKNKIIDKNNMLCYLNNIYNKREKNNPYIKK